MIKIKKSILSVLLFSFVFLVVHDYIVHQTSGLITYELCAAEKTALIKVDSKSLIESQLHENIHNLLAVAIDVPLDTFTPSNTQPTYIQLGFTSHISFILERPPLFS